MPSENNRGLFCHEKTIFAMCVKFYFYKIYLFLMFRNIIQPEGKENLEKSMRRTVRRIRE
jgi:hypothetical protein